MFNWTCTYPNFRWPIPQHILHTSSFRINRLTENKNIKVHSAFKVMCLTSGQSIIRNICCWFSHANHFKYRLTKKSGDRPCIRLTTEWCFSIFFPFRKSTRFFSSSKVCLDFTAPNRGYWELQVDLAKGREAIGCFLNLLCFCNSWSLAGVDFSI